MIKAFSIKNFKAFPELKFDVEKVNILLGKNSIGKTCVIEFLMLLSQTLESDNLDEILILNWKLIKLWGIDDIMHSTEKSNATSLMFEIETTSELTQIESFLRRKHEELENRVNNAADDAYYILRRLLKGVQEESFKGQENVNKIEQHISVYEWLLLKKNPKYQHDEERTEIETILSWIQKAKKLLKTFNLTESDNEKFFRYSKVEKFSHKGMKFILDYIKALQKSISESKNKNFKYSFELKRNLKKLSFKEARVSLWEIEIYRIEKNKKGFSMSSSLDMKMFNHYKKSIQASTILSHFIPRIKSSGNRDKIEYEVLYKLTEVANFPLYDALDITKIKHINPLRANPQRHYILDETFDFSSEKWESLAQELSNEEVKEFTNNWLRKFWLEVYVESINETFLKTIRIQQYGWARNIMDVWFWISQVLPVIVQSIIAKEKSIILIEQPEIHLHPSMQADLADLFIEIIRRKKIILFIETHSEYLLNRLKLRLVQNFNKSETEYKISAEDIGIYFFEENKEKQCSEVKRVKIHEYGKIDFPKDFKESELDDAFLYMKELLKSDFNHVEK